MSGGWVAMKTGDYIEIGRSRFIVCHMAQKVIITPVNICVQDRRW
jgi:hypothetical protein